MEGCLVADIWASTAQSLHTMELIIGSSYEGIIVRGV